MDLFPFIFTGTAVGALSFSLYAARQSFKGINQSKLLKSLNVEDDQPKNKKRGTTKTTNVLTVLPDGIIRTRDGGYLKGYRFKPSESYYSADDSIRRLYDSFALLLTSDLPKNSVLQIRFDNHVDEGHLLNDHILEMSLDIDQCDQAAVLLKQEEINYYFELAHKEHFRFGSFSAWLYLPSTKKGIVKNGIAGIWEGIFRGNFNEVKESFLKNEKSVVCRHLQDEEKCYETAKRNYRTFEQSFPLELKPYSFEETCVHLRLSHNPSIHSLPVPPQNIDTDWQSYLCRSSISHQPNDWFLWNGNIPYTVISLFEPPESNHENPTCYPSLMRFLTTNPTLKGRCSVITEYVYFDKNESVTNLKKELKRMKQTNTRPSGAVEFKDEKTKRAYQEKQQMLNELTSPGKALTSMRFQILVQGREVRYQEERKPILKELQQRSQDIIKLINENMKGSQADFEDSVALRENYEKLLLGEVTSESRHREIKEQALSLACFIPCENDWKGIEKDAHNLFINSSGEIVGVNLLRNPHSATPLTLILGSSGSGKSVLAAELISGFLGKIPKARVRACDYGGSLAPLVNLFNGRYFRFSDKNPRTINVWDFDGLEQAQMPEDDQIELVVKDTLILLGADERTEVGKDFIAVLEKCVRQVYSDEVPRNAPGRRHEPRLSHLIRKLRTFPFESNEEKTIANRMASRLENFENNPWVDAETDESYRQNSRFDVFELSSLDKLPDSLRSCLAFRIGAKIGTGDDEIEGIHPPTLVVLDEVHEYVNNEYLSFTLRGAEKTVRHGRKKNKVPILITHSFDDIKDFHGFTSNIGSIFVGKQDDITSLKNLRRWNSTIESSIYGIENQKGIAHQFIYNTGQGENQKTTTIQVYLSPISLWTFTTEPVEDEARKVLSNALPHWTWAQVLVTLARKYERGLTAAGKTSLDEAWINELIEQEQQNNPSYKQYVRQMNKLNRNILELPAEFDLEELAEEAIEIVSEEIDKIKRETFDFSVPSEIAGMIDIPNAVIVGVQGE